MLNKYTPLVTRAFFRFRAALENEKTPSPPHSSFAIRHSPFAIRHSPFSILHSPFAILHSPFAILIILPIYALLTIAMTWPLITHLNTHFAGQNIDVWINPWATWWTEKALFEGQNLYYTRHMFYPHGTSLVFHSFSHLNTAIALLTRPLLGNLGAHNLTVLLAHTLSGYTMFCLVRHLTRKPAAAFLAGLVFAFYPYRMATSVHPVLFSTQWMPLYFLHLIRLVEQGRKRHILPIALCFLLTALSSWHLMLFTCFATALYFAYLLLAERRRHTRATVYNLAWMSLVIGLITLPFVYPLLREQLTSTRNYVGVELGEGYGNDLVAFFLPAEQHPFFRELVIPAHARIKSVRAAYLGATVVALSIIACKKRWQQSRFWLLLTLLSMLFSLHPTLHVWGKAWGITLPWSVPIVWLLRHPYRFNLMVGLGLAVLSGFGASEILTSRKRAHAWPLAGTLVALVLFEYLYFPFPLTPATVSNYYAQLASTPGDGPVLELPMGRQNSKYYLYYQTFHGKPMLEGVVSRTAHEAYSFIEATPILRALRDCGERALPPADFVPVVDALHQAGVDAVILHRPLTRPAAWEAWTSVRGLQPDHEDDEIAAYQTRPITSTSGNRPQLLEGCIAVQNRQPAARTAHAGETLNLDLEWITGGVPPDDFILSLTLVDAGGQTIRQHAYELVPGISIKSWHMGKHHPASYAFPLDTLIPSGTYHVRAALLPARHDRANPLSVDIVTLTIETKAQSVRTSQRNNMNVDYGSNLRLLGYTSRVNDDTLYLTLRWQSLRRMEIDYTFFVHLYDAQSGALVAQADTMPQNWTFPTTWWQEGQIITETFTLSLNDVPAGKYNVGIGMYDAVTGTRAPITHAPAQSPIMADAFILEQLEHRGQQE